jgi:hypothetical protein
LPNLPKNTQIQFLAMRYTMRGSNPSSPIFCTARSFLSL